MKTFIITAAATLLSTSAFAFNASWDADEYYSGVPTPKSMQGAGLANIDNNLYLEGNFVKVDKTSGGMIEGAEIGSAFEPETRYLEGSFDV